MKHFFFTISFLGSCLFFAKAQTAETFISHNNVEARITNWGSLFYDFNTGFGHFRVPKTGTQSTVCASTPWIGGVSNGQLYLMAETYRQSGRDVQQGPVTGTYSSEFLAYWDRIWTVSAVGIQNFRNIIAQGGTPDETIYRDILEWPATGNLPVGDNTAAYAPFVDINNDHQYTPMDGDYPLIRGDVANFSIMNDDLLHTESLSASLQLEIHRMTYEYASNDAVNNTLFVSYHIVNRSTRTYDSLIVGNWTDFDLGNAFDDFVGTDTVLDYVYAFNGDSEDETPFGYGSTPPAQACAVLNHPLWASMYYQNTFAPTNGNPIRPEDYYNYIQGRWLDGTGKKAAGNGHQTNGSETRFSYAGHPCTNTGWWEGNSGSTPGDRRVVASIQPQTLAPDQAIDLDLAFVYNRAATGDNIASVCGLTEAVNTVRDFYSMHTALPQTPDQTFTFSVFPNPAIQDVSVLLQAHQKGTITVTNLTGKIVAQQSTLGQSEVRLSNLPAGMYLVNVQTNAGTATQKLLVTE